MRQPYRDRTKVLTRHWVDYGFGAPKITGLIYIFKLLFFYALGGVLVATLTSGLDPLDPAALVGRPDRLPEARALDRAAGVPRRRRVMGPAGRALQALHRGLAPLRAAGNDPPAAVAGQGALHPGRRAHGGRRRALPRGAGEPRRRACPPRPPPTASSPPARSSRSSCWTRRARPARQDLLPRCARRAVPAGADLLRLLPVRRHDRRGEAADRDRLVRRGVLEVRPPLRQRDPADGLQHAVAVRSSGSSGCTTAPSPRTCARPSAPSAWRTSAARWSSS